MVKNLPANAGVVGSALGLGRIPGEGSSNPLQYSCLGNSRDRGAWWAAIHGVCKRVGHNLVSEHGHVLFSESLLPFSHQVGFAGGTKELAPFMCHMEINKSF